MLPVSRQGTTLAEMLVVMVLTGILFSAVAGVVRHSGRLVRAQHHRMEVGEARLTVRAVLQGDLRWLVPATDLHREGTAALSLRAARGVGIVCRTGPRVLYVRYRGLRAPAGAKDSVLALDGPEAAALQDARRADGACDAAAGEPVYALHLQHDMSASAVLVFERGAYHLADGALRYRLGGAGRQPLTASLFREPRFDPGNAAGGPAITALLSAPDPDHAYPDHGTRLTIYLLNASAPADTATPGARGP